jgi:leucyl aminopeptidase (aminopeptidase T)
MRDGRIGKIAENLVSYSMDVQPGEHIMIMVVDEGARYIGEFAIAFNPSILHPMGDILFDRVGMFKYFTV